MLSPIKDEFTFMEAASGGGARQRRRNTNVAYVILASMLSGIVCYRVGLFTGCANPWILDYRSMDSFGFDDPAFYGSSSQPRTPSKRRGVDRRSVPRTNLPYDCGEFGHRAALTTEMHRLFSSRARFLLLNRCCILLPHTEHRWGLHQLVVQKVLEARERAARLLSVVAAVGEEGRVAQSRPRKVRE